MSYGKVHDVYWESETIEALSDQAALLGVFLISGPHRTAIGCFKLGLGAITDNPRFGKWGIEGVSKALRELSEMGFIVRDDRTGWTFIRNALKHDPIKGGKAAIHAAKLAFAVPENSVAYKALKKELEPQLKAEEKALENAVGWPMRSPIEGVSKAQPSPEPEPKPQPEPQPKPQPQPDATPLGSPQGKAQANAMVDLGDRVLVAIGVDPEKTPTSYGTVGSWIAAGYDVELDILPTVQRLAKRPNFRFKSFSYFTDAIDEAWRERQLKVPAFLQRTAPGPRQNSPAEAAYLAAMESWLALPPEDRAKKPRPELKDFEQQQGVAA